MVPKPDFGPGYGGVKAGEDDPDFIEIHGEPLKPAQSAPSYIKLPKKLGALTPAQMSAQPTRMDPGFKTKGMTNAAIANQMAWNQQPRWYKQYEMKNRYRGMRESERIQTLDRLFAAQAAARDLGGEPLPENRYSSRVPVGATADQRMAMDYDKLTPESRMVYDQVVPKFRREISSLFQSDSSKWNSIEDMDEAVNGLESVRSHGHMFEGEIYDTLRRFASPTLKAKFDANDRTHAEWTRWWKEKRADAGELIIDGDHPDAVWADDSPRATAIKKMFNDDPNFTKWRERNGKIEVQPLSPEQERSLKMKELRESEELRTSMHGEASDAAIAAMPENVRGMFFKDGSGRLQSLPTRVPSPEEQQATIMELSGMDEAQFRAAHELKTTTKGNYQWVAKKVDRAAEKAAYRRLGRADEMMQRGIPLAADKDGNPIVDGWQNHVVLRNVKTRQPVTPEDKRYDNLNDMIARGEWAYEYVSKLPRYAGDDAQVTGPTPQAPAQTAPSVPPNIQAALDHIKANPNDKEVRQKLIELGYLRQ